MKRKATTITIALTLCVGLAMQALSAPPETGVVEGDGWKYVAEPIIMDE